MDVKVSALVLHMAHQAGADPAAVASEIVRTWGAERVMWASDRTVHPEPYAALIAEAEAAFANLTDTERRLIFGDGAATRWWPS